MGGLVPRAARAAKYQRQMNPLMHLTVIVHNVGKSVFDAHRVAQRTPRRNASSYWQPRVALICLAEEINDVASPTVMAFPSCAVTLLMKAPITLQTVE